METIGERIKRLRKDCGLSANALAKKLGKSLSTINRYENGEIASIPANIMVTLANALETTPEYILYGTDPGETNVIHATKTTSSVAERIKHCMDIHHKTKDDIIKDIGITQEAYDNMINGMDRTFDIKLMVKFCDYFGTSYDYFITNRNPVHSLYDNIAALLRIDENTPEELSEILEIKAEKILKPSFSELEKIADYFGFDVEDLLFKDFVEAEKDIFLATRVRMQTFSKAWADGVGYVALNDNQLNELIAYANFMLIRDKVKK